MNKINMEDQVLEAQELLIELSNIESLLAKKGIEFDKIKVLETMDQNGILNTYDAIIDVYGNEAKTILRQIEKIYEKGNF